MSTADKLNKVLETKADIKLALIDKGLNPSDVFSTYADNIRAINKSIWTGHVDVEGLKAIGWDDEDIAYYQEHGVDWMEEDDEYHKVSDDNKALYGVLTIDNYQTYKDYIEYLPKLDVRNKENLNFVFKNSKHLVAIPMLDVSHITSFSETFYNCPLLRCVFPMNNTIATGINRIMYNCRSLTIIPLNLNCNEPTNLSNTFYSCANLQHFQDVHYSLSNDLDSAFLNCYNLKTFPSLDVGKVTSLLSTFNSCYSLIKIEIINLKANINFKDSLKISKHSLFYMIEHEAATEPITITLHANAYARLSTDPDIIAALENHPLVSLASV